MASRPTGSLKPASSEYVQPKERHDKHDHRA
jgi:hypothetical protein